MAREVNVKAHLWVDGKLKEMRRFEVDSYYNFHMYNKLVKTIEDLFKVSSYKLSYKDTDGDMVVFSSIQEMEHAVKFLKDNTLYVHIFTNNRTVQGNELVLAKRK